ncbi:MAG TPA: alanine racemase [Solirubrobacteraceae bacterium]|jgi:alanine racemase|nr:alanine racemase [Solirubrobacteraceae bacterium]
MIRALARVDAGAIERNCARLAALAPLCAVVKADGYGHGAVPAARAALRGGARWLAVATAREAQELRTAGVDGPLLIMGALSREEIPIAARAAADVVAWREDFAAALPPHLRAHVKLDTGMGRLGTRDPDEASRVVRALGDRCAGLMTHFATADEDDQSFVDAQLAAFEAWRARHPGLLAHAANSAAALRRPDARLDMVRCGIAIYGMDPFHRDPAAHGLEPALELVSYVAEIKRCEPGQSAGYGRRFVARRPTWLGTIPIGYGDGYRRALTNNAEVLIEGRRFPVAGTVSMDNITVDLGSDPPARGAEVVLIGNGILAEELAARVGTINYEITCGISGRVPREYA